MNDLLLADSSKLIGYAVLAAVIVVTTLSMMRSTRKSRSGSSPTRYAQEQLAKLKNQKAIKGDMEELLVQLQELSRQINAQIDTKFAKLEASIRSADERIDALGRLRRALDGKPTIDAVVGDVAVASPAQSDSASPPPSAEPHSLIYQEADRGRSLVDIARETGRTTGEIELILALRGKPRPSA
jgi:hypothetical protein